MKPTYCAVMLPFLAASMAAAPDPTGVFTYAQDREFLSKHTKVIELTTDDGRARIALVAAFQGRVMTSTARGLTGVSHGWINRPVVATSPHATGGQPNGGEDRFWLAPMGTEFASYYPPEAKFDDNHWRIPDGLDQGSYEITGQGADFVAFRHPLELQKFVGTRYNPEVNRRVNLFTRDAIARQLGVPLAADVGAVGYESVNTAINRGAPWRPDTGMLSVWTLGMFPGREHTTIVAPLAAGGHPGEVNRYLAPVDARRFTVRGGCINFRGDGCLRSKFGILPRSAGKVVGSYDPAHGLLTVIRYAPLDRAGLYPSGFTGPQKNPWEGDVVSSCNNGPLTDTVAPAADATFYELESCSPVKPLAQGEFITHIQQTFHFEGMRAHLDLIATAIFVVTTSTISAALSHEPQTPDSP